MQIGHADNETVDISTLVEDLLGLDPAELAAMAPSGRHKNDPVILGLQALLRRAFLLALEIRDQQDVVLRLAGDLSDPDARIENLTRMLVYALVPEYRFYNNLPFLALDDHLPSASDTALASTLRFADMTTPELIKEVRRFPDRKPGKKVSSESYPVSICAVAWEMLGIEPKDIRSRFTDRSESIEDAFARDPEKQTRLGLDVLIGDVNIQLSVMRKRNIDSIRLMGEDDAAIAHRPSARMANLITVLSAALLADNEHVITFEAPKPRPAGEEDLLRAAAKLVYLDYSHEALLGLELLCDRNVHFGSFDRFSRANELLAAVRAECDPDMQRMPFPVAVQEVGFQAIAAAGPNGRYKEK